MFCGCLLETKKLKSRCQVVSASPVSRCHPGTSTPVNRWRKNTEPFLSWNYLYCGCGCAFDLQQNFWGLLWRFVMSALPPSCGVLFPPVGLRPQLGHTSSSWMRHDAIARAACQWLFRTFSQWELISPRRESKSPETSAHLNATPSSPKPPPRCSGPASVSSVRDFGGFLLQNQAWDQKNSHERHIVSQIGHFWACKWLFETQFAH